MKVLVCGGRDYFETATIWETLDNLHKEHSITEVIDGGANGADIRAAEWAIHNGITSTTVPADWEHSGKKAGYLRNVAMAEMKPDLVVAFPGGRGTAMMIRIAKERNIAVFEPMKED